MIRRYRAVVMYDGTAYQGFQRQKREVPTIQAALEAAIMKVTGQETTVNGAGRTDTGVHASGQVIAFDVEWKHPPTALLKALNAALPDDIALQAVEMLPEGDPFHPRFDAVSRVYRYDVLCTSYRQPIDRFRAWQFAQAIDGERLQHAAEMLIGRHDFGAFGQPPADGENTIREVIRSEWAQFPADFGFCWRYTVEANAFLKHMVRRLVGHAIDVAKGTRSIEDFERLFRGGQLVPNWTIAPPQGLTLVKVNYADPRPDGSPKFE